MTGGQPTTVTYCTQGDQNKSDQDIYLTMEGQKLIILGQFSVRGSWRKSHCGKKKMRSRKRKMFPGPQIKRPQGLSVQLRVSGYTK